MKKLIKSLILPIAIGIMTYSNISAQKSIDSTYETPVKLKDSMSLDGKYKLSKYKYELALKKYHSGDTIKSLELFKESTKLLSESGSMTNQDFIYLGTNKELNRLEKYEKINGLEKHMFDNSNYVFENIPGYDDEKFKQRVDNWKDYFRFRHRKWFDNTRSRINDWFPYIDSLFRANNIDPFIKWMYPVESAMKQIIGSQAGAIGFSQLMAGTAREKGLRVYGQWYDERRDGPLSIAASADHLKMLDSKFNNSYLTITAYNLGHNGIVRRIKRARAKSYSDLANAGELYRETLNHIPKIIAFMELAQEIGIPTGNKNKTIENILKNNFDIITIDKEIDLEIVAKYAKVKLSTLKEYNPAYGFETTPPSYMVKSGEYSFDFRIPKNTLEKEHLEDNFENLLTDVKARIANPTIIYKIKSGNTLGGLAVRYKTTVNKIKRLNPGIDPNRLRVGQKINIPRY